jgi:poly-beta-1,6-N-acetyl-D-glucosamine biosynthesis protein PgaD
MMPVLPVDWPPLLADAKLPRHVVWRDILLTIGAWLLLYWLVWRGIMLISDDLTGVSGAPLHGSEADWTVWWVRLRFYAVAVGLLAIWLAIWGMVSRRRIRRYHSLPNVVPLSLAEEAAGAGCSEAELRAWRELKSVVVHFDSSNRVIVGPSCSK